jgi:hypothetical protein
MILEQQADRAADFAFSPFSTEENLSFLYLMFFSSCNQQQAVKRKSLL